ncbi:MAG TPA: adenylosuccinate lyase [Smithellaceae bacterium]|nr:adenylosuccinate lyase [Smithellaceae bacterium]HQG79444.1 adenylosuccinate lyase [Smithellaceae bacterium]
MPVIPRYSREKMTALWSRENKYRKWLEVEIAASEAMARLGKIPASALEAIKARALVDVHRIDEIEEVTRHDVIAFVTSLAEAVGPEGRYIHMGLTSSDVLDTALALLLAEAAQILIDDIDQLLAVLRRLAFEHKNTLMIGRSHGIHAEPITFGLKMALWYQEMQRNRERLLRAKENVSYGKVSGAVGTFAFIDPFVEEYVCRKLGLKPAPVSSQIIQRDRHAEYFTTLAIIASSLDKFAQEIRLLQRTEVREAEEFFSTGQKGSSAMPHKRNPVLSENVSGLSRLVRSYAMAALENISLWHERDISHSSVERVISPDATIALDFMLARFTSLMDRLVVYPERMRANLNMTRGLIFSQTVLLALVEKGATREDAYAAVQKHAMRSWQEETDFRRLLDQDELVQKHLSEKELDDIFNVGNFLTRLDYIFRRVFG